MKNKRKIISFGAITTLVVPISLAGSCINKTKKTNAIQLPTPKPLANKNLEHLLANIKDDGLYLVKGFYGGHIYDANNMYSKTNDDSSFLSKNLYEKIKSKIGYTEGVIELKSGDSIIMAYDEDDNDGLNQDNFEKTIFFHDSSIPFPSHKAIKDINTDLGIEVSGDTFKYYFIPFLNGKLIKYFATQSNHSKLSWVDAMKEVKKNVPANVYTALENYYQEASKVFVPLSPEHTFKYERIGKRIVKITFIGTIPISAASFAIKQNNKFVKHGIFSLTELDWVKYEAGENYKFLGRHV